MGDAIHRRRQDVTWSSWDNFKNELQGQFGEIDEQGAARAKLMRIVQGWKRATEYWNEYRETSLVRPEWMMQP